MRFVSNVLKVLAGLAAGAFLLYLGGNALAVGAGAVERHRLADDVSDLLVRVLPGVEDAQQELVDDVGRDPDRRWIEQACRFETDESGWIVQDYRETCVLRGVTAWRVESEGEARGLVPDARSRLTAYGGCLPLGVAGDPGVVEGAAAMYVDDAASDGEPWCTRELGTSDEARALVGERTGLAGGRWLLLVTEQPLVDESIGCAHWSIIFCDNPWSSHAFGEAPGS